MIPFSVLLTFAFELRLAESTYVSINVLEKKSKGRISQDANGTLRVRKVTKTDPTQFMCYVSLNASDAEAISQVVKIDVRCEWSGHPFAGLPIIFC